MMQTIGEMVTEDYRTASIFKKHKIDFCCKGNRSIQEVCEEKDLDMNILKDELNSAMKPAENNTIDFNF